ncbi:MAG TPA: hypothetical protein V6C89_21665 [Drouetiella sp.]|jgi:hypothetical protein
MNDTFRKILLGLVNDDLPASAQFTNVVEALRYLARSQTGWATAPSSQTAFDSLAKWSRNRDLSESELTAHDVSRVVSLLFTVPLDTVYVTNEAGTNFQSQSFSAQMFYGAVAIACVSKNSQRVLSLLSFDNSNGLLVVRAFSEGVYLVSGKEVVSDVNLAEPELFAIVAGLLSRCLQKYPVHELVPLPTDALPVALQKLRYASASALSRQAIDESK